MADQKREQGTPQKPGRESGQKGTERRDVEPQGDRNPQPHKKGTETGKDTRDF